MVELISVHIGKTAGTTFLNVLLDIYGNNGVLKDYNSQGKKVYQQTPPETIKVIHGHFNPKKYRADFPDAKYIVWLRHPIFRLISQYFYAQTIEDNQDGTKTLARQLGIIEFAKQPQIKNRQSRYIEGMNLNDFYFVGIQEFYLEDLDELKKMMQWENLKVTKTNLNSHPNYYKELQKIITKPEIMNELAFLNNEDMEMYYNALNLRAQRRKESKWLQPTLAEWNRTQFILQQMQEQLEKQEMEIKKYQTLTAPLDK